MATNDEDLLSRLVDERATVTATLDTIDLVDERALIAAAEADLQAAQAVFHEAAERYTLVSEKVDRLAILDAQIAFITP